MASLSSFSNYEVGLAPSIAKWINDFNYLWWVTMLGIIASGQQRNTEGNEHAETAFPKFSYYEI